MYSLFRRDPPQKTLNTTNPISSSLITLTRATCHDIELSLLRLLLPPMILAAPVKLKLVFAAYIDVLMSYIAIDA